MSILTRLLTIVCCLNFIQLSSHAQKADKGMDGIIAAQKYAVKEIKTKYCEGDSVSIPNPTVVLDSYQKQRDLVKGDEKLVYRPHVSGIAFCKNETNPMKTLHWTVDTENGIYQIQVQSYEIPIELRL